MKISLKKLMFGLLSIFTIILNTSCSGDKDEPAKYSWNDIVGFYVTKPEKLDLGNYDWSVYYKAYALRIEEYVLTDCGAIDNSDLVEGYIDTYCTELKGNWYTDIFEWDIFGLNINGTSVDLYDNGRPTGASIEICDNYVKYKGRTYYKASYFNQHVDEWTKDTSIGNSNNNGNSTPIQNENVSVSISAKTISSNRFSRKYEITVKATGSNFTVQQIGLERVSGLFVPTSIYTSANQHTFSETYTSSSSSTICGYVKTSSGKTYRSSNISISK